MKIGAIILAAGASSRLGSPKQLLLYAGQTLLRATARNALAAGCRPVIVVLGANADQVQAPLLGLDVKVTVNPAWEKGLGTSVRLGLSTLTAVAPLVDAALLLVCDQPLVQSGDLNRLLDAFAASPADAIAAAAYGGTIGVPAVFGRAHFAALDALPDAAGAKRILLENAAAVIPVEIPAAAVDIDTWEQYKELGGEG